MCSATCWEPHDTRCRVSGPVIFSPAASVGAMAVLVAVSLWASLLAAGAVDRSVLDHRCRTRLAWWRTRARPTYLACAAAVLVAAVLQIDYTLR